MACDVSGVVRDSVAFCVSDDSTIADGRYVTGSFAEGNCTSLTGDGRCARSVTQDPVRCDGAPTGSWTWIADRGCGLESVGEFWCV